MHNLFGRCFAKAFSLGGGHPQADTALHIAAAPDEDEADENARYRAELNRNVRHALTFWESSPAWQVELRVHSLKEEQLIMHKVLTLSAIETEHRGFEQVQRTGQTPE